MNTNFKRGQILTETFLGELEHGESATTQVMFLDEDNESILVFLTEETGGLANEDDYKNLTLADVLEGNYKYDDVMVEEGLVVLSKMEDGKIETCLGYEVTLTENEKQG